MALPSSPSVGRPAHGFTTGRAQKWVLTAAILVAVMYAFRRIVEPSVTTAPARGGTAAKITGAGSPPPALGQWAVSYGVGFLLLSVIALGAPELAASVAMLMVAGSFLTNGTSLIADISGLEGKTPNSPAVNAAAQAVTQTSPAIAQGAAAGETAETGGSTIAGQGAVTGIGQVAP
jgi:hypothetical protein